MDTDDIDYYLAMEEEVQMEQDEMEPWDEGEDETKQLPADAPTAIAGKVALSQITTPPAINVAKVDFHSKEKEPFALRITATNVPK